MKSVRNKYEKYIPEEEIVSSLIKPCPSPKDLGLSCSEYRIKQYEALLFCIKNKYDDNIGLIVIFLILPPIWFLGMWLLDLILPDNSFFDILGNIIGILWLLFQIALGDTIIDLLRFLVVKLKFKHLNNKQSMSEEIVFGGLRIDKFSKKELSQIEVYISFRKNFDKTKSQAESIVKETLKK